jgi:hypothetical protein
VLVAQLKRRLDALQSSNVALDRTKGVMDIDNPGNASTNNGRSHNGGAPDEDFDYDQRNQQQQQQQPQRRSSNARPSHAGLQRTSSGAQLLSEINSTLAANNR